MKSQQKPQNDGYRLRAMACAVASGVVAHQGSPINPDLVADASIAIADAIELRIAARENVPDEPPEPEA